MSIYAYFLLFIMYSILGWIVETLYIFARTKKLVNRGFLIGPYCPIYGWGCMAITLLLKKLMPKPFLLFLMAIVICSLLEYFTSYFMEKMFKTRWWDYSNTKFNINGRICLNTMLPFGILGTFIMYLVNPGLTKIVTSIPANYLKIISITVFIIYLIDNIISFGIVAKFTKNIKNIKKDSTENIKRYTKKILESKNILNKRLINAFPNIKNKLNSLRKEIRKIRSK